MLNLNKISLYQWLILMLLRINVINSFGIISDITNLFSKKFDLKKLCENTSSINGLLQEIKAFVDLCKKALGLSIKLSNGPYPSTD
jgi:hypothetical protein